MPTVDGWRRRRCTLTTKYGSAVRKKGTLPFVTTWPDLEGIIRSEIIQTETGERAISLTDEIYKARLVDMGQQNAGRWSKGT